MKIIYYISDYFPILSGTTVQLHNTIASLPAEVSCPGIITPQINSSSQGQETILPIPFIHLPFISKIQNYSVAGLGSFRKLYSLLRNLKPDIVHAIINIHIDPGLYYLIFICRILKIKLVFSYHTHLEKYFPYMFNKPFTLFSKFTLRLSLRFLYHFYAKPILLPSKYFQEYFQSLGLKKTELWEFCINKSLFNNHGREKIIYEKDKTQKRLIFVGRLEVEKNIKKLLELFSQLREKDKSFHLTLCGKGGLSSLLKDKEGISYRGEIENEKLPQTYKEHDVFLTCSDTESFGNTTVEAMACGLVVVAADAGGTKTIINHGENGLLFNVANLSAARDMIIDLFADTVKMSNLSQKALMSANTYNKENSVKNLIRSYSRCLNENA